MAIKKLTVSARNIERLKTVEDGIWADLEAGEAPPYLPGHAIKRFHQHLLEELAVFIDRRVFDHCLQRASDRLPRPTPCESAKT